MKSSYLFPIVHITPIATNTIEIGFDTAGSDFTFHHGQYISIVQPELEEQSIKEAYREFSIVNAPDDPILRVAFRVSPSIFKQHLLKKKVGDKMVIEGPFGVFYPSEHAVEAVYIAGGIGITAFMSHLQTAGPKRHISVFTFNKSEASAPYFRELQLLEEKTGMKLHQYNGEAVLEHLKLQLEPGTEILVAGPNGFVKSVRKILGGMGIMKQAIKTEEFTGYA